MPTKIKRGQSLLIPFKDGMTIYDSQNKPRMYLTQKAFENSFPRHLIYRKGVELVEYAEVVRCGDCKYGNLCFGTCGESTDILCVQPNMFPLRTSPEFYCAHGEKGGEVEG